MVKTSYLYFNDGRCLNNHKIRLPKAMVSLNPWLNHAALELVIIFFGCITNDFIKAVNTPAMSTGALLDSVVLSLREIAAMMTFQIASWPNPTGNPDPGGESINA